MIDSRRALEGGGEHRLLVETVSLGKPGVVPVMAASTRRTPARMNAAPSPSHCATSPQMAALTAKVVYKTIWKIDSARVCTNCGEDAWLVAFMPARLGRLTARTREGVAMTETVRGLGELKALSGKDLGSSGWLEVTQDRVNMFAEATGDNQWIHVDVERAKSGPFGGTIAHGYLTLSLIVPLFAEVLDIQDVKMGVNYGLDKVRFPSPVPVGSRIRLNASVHSVEEVAGNGVQSRFDFTVEVDGSDKPGCVAQALYRHYG